MPISREESAVLSAGVGAFVKVDVDYDAEPNVGTPVPRLGRDTKFEEEKQRGGIVDEKLERHDGKVETKEDIANYKMWRFRFLSYFGAMVPAHLDLVNWSET